MSKPQGVLTYFDWDLINRNNEAIVTGLYYWVVQSDYGQQIGKVAIIK